MMDFCKRVNIVCGHYGSGKTNLAVNLAVDLKRQGKDVTLVDLDIVNPYFRSADFTEALNANGIQTINPAFANTNLDIPALTASMYSVFENKSGAVVIDVGGDDAGAAAMGRYARFVLEEDDYACLYVVNKCRYLTRKPEEAVAVLREIEYAARLKATGIINNSNVSYQTTSEIINTSMQYAKEVARLANLPLVATAYDRRLLCSVEGGYPVDVFVKPPWEGQTTITI